MSDDVSRARTAGREHGWRHAAFLDAYGTEADRGRSLDEIRTGTRPGWVTSERAIWAYRDGFDEGMTAYEQGDDDDTGDGTQGVPAGTQNERERKRT
jgi:hypothetical protein